MGKFKDEASLSSCVFSKLPCVKSIVKTVTQKIIDNSASSEQSEKMPGGAQSDTNSEKSIRQNRPYYSYLSVQGKRIYNDAQGRKILETTTNGFTRSSSPNSKKSSEADCRKSCEPAKMCPELRPNQKCHIR